MLRVVAEACHFEQDRSRGTIVVESDCGGPQFQAAFSELEGMECVKLAQQFAAMQGCAPPLLNGNKSSPYPVNSEGKSLEAVRGANGEALPQQSPLMQPARYRVDIPITRPIGG